MHLGQDGRHSAEDLVWVILAVRSHKGTQRHQDALFYLGRALAPQDDSHLYTSHDTRRSSSCGPCFPLDFPSRTALAVMLL